MPTPDYAKLRKVLQDAADLTRRIATGADAAPLEAICKRLETKNLTFKELRGPVDDVMNRVGIRLDRILFDENRNVRPGMDRMRTDVGIQNFDQAYAARSKLHLVVQRACARGPHSVEIVFENRAAEQPFRVIAAR